MFLLIYNLNICPVKFSKISIFLKEWRWYLCTRIRVTNFYPYSSARLENSMSTIQCFFFHSSCITQDGIPRRVKESRVVLIIAYSNTYNHPPTSRCAMMEIISSASMQSRKFTRFSLFIHIEITTRMENITPSAAQQTRKRNGATLYVYIFANYNWPSKNED